MTTEESTTARRESTRARIIEAADRILRSKGPAAVTTRAVAQEAGLQPPALYRLFDDKEALLDAVAEHAFAEYVEGKKLVAATDDPVADLRAGWDAQIGFGLANPSVFALLSTPGRQSPTTEAGLDVLRGRVHRVAAAGRLRVPEQEAVDLIHAAGTGAVHTLLGKPESQRTTAVADALYAAVAATILGDAPALPADDTTAAAVSFRALIHRLPRLSEAERSLMTEWLDRATAE
ncbi:Nucleoid occlusion factor SlmA [Streptomyces sp. YIM 130001]|uniref:TetR/AcrR family transcriptional regulator n=1 Tax=Streptomyces sp. YIM 130001 TaxID=2259644 RepID=UPI000E655A1E|nr:TetR/AcrR family transcriptional regulator [Streptomyces sp. YIM 130001]RII22203.1 Nucleoid occlusion factor SlmA [Streptomyces sp. YIM 130001]